MLLLQYNRLIGRGGMNINNKEVVLYFKAMADETRLSILQMLSTEQLCACHILEEFEITQPTLSYHMKILVDSGLVNREKDGTWTRYSINSKIFESVSKLVNSFDVTGKDIKKRCV